MFFYLNSEQTFIELMRTPRSHNHSQNIGTYEMKNTFSQPEHLLESQNSIIKKHVKLFLTASFPAYKRKQAMI